MRASPGISADLQRVGFFGEALPVPISKIGDDWRSDLNAGTQIGLGGSYHVRAAKWSSVPQ